MQDNMKTILIISPQTFDWPVSKRHYATAMAEMGHQVYFLEPLRYGSVPSITIKPSSAWSSLFIVNVTIPLPGRFKFLLGKPALHHIHQAFMTVISKLVKRKLPRVDYLLSFDNDLVIGNLGAFGADKVGLLAMDTPRGTAAHRRVRNLHDQVRSVGAVAPDFLKPFEHRDCSTYLMHHGLSSTFAALAHDRLEAATG